MYLADTFSDTGEVNLSLQGKQLTLFVAYDKHVSFQAKLEIWKASLYSHELGSFPMPEHFCDEIGGDSNKNSIKISCG